MTDTSFPCNHIRITLLENSHPAAATALEARGYGSKSSRARSQATRCGT